MLVASDPLWDGNRLLALVAVRIEQQWAVLLTTFDPQTGARRAAQRIGTFRDSWMDGSAPASWPRWAITLWP